MSEIIYIDKEGFPEHCDCGRDHGLLTEKTIIGENVLEGFEDYLAQAGFKGSYCTVYDENTYQALEGRRPRGSKKEIILDPEGLHADEHGLALLAEQYVDCDFMVAAGAGTVHDLTRYTSTEKGIPFASVPTAASVDGFTASVAAMTLKGFKKTVTAQAPRLLVGDTAVISKAPGFLTASGFGDVLGKYVSLTDWQIARELTGEYYCNQVADLTMQAVEGTCSASAGIAAGDPGAYGILMKALVFSGIAMQMVGNSRPASGAEHHVSHLIEMGVPWLPHSDALHGEKVGVGTLLNIPRYKSWIGKNPDGIIAALEKFTDHGSEELHKVYGDALADSIITENADCCLNKVTPAAVAEKWDMIQKFLTELPTEESVRSMLLSVGGLTTLEEIGVPAEKAEDILLWSPYVRNRLTFNRLLHVLG